VETCNSEMMIQIQTTLCSEHTRQLKKQTNSTTSTNLFILKTLSYDFSPDFRVMFKYLNL